MCSIIDVKGEVHFHYEKVDSKLVEESIKEGARFLRRSVYMIVQNIRIVKCAFMGLRIYTYARVYK